METQELTSDLHVAEAGRLMMAQQLAKILIYERQVRAGADMIAVHEMRKAIRRTFTSFKLFGPYFKRGKIKAYRRGLRRIMRRLGRSRDLAVFRLKLDSYNESAEWPLEDLSAYWQSQQTLGDDTLMRYLDKPKQQAFLETYRSFTETPALGALTTVDPWVSDKIGHLAPVLIYQRVAAVRAFDDHLQSATVEQLHRLRIQFKELRYTLQFFEPLLNPEIQAVLLRLKQSQEHLGDLNDATVALRFLSEVPGLEISVGRYRSFQQDEQQRLVHTFLPVWQGFDQPAWRQTLAMTMAAL
jgi:CHAD domain-containing protein